MARMSSNPSKPAWNPWPVSIISFFTIAVIGCGSFVAFCTRHPADLVAADYYEQEVRYQDQLDRIQHTAAAAQTASIAYNPATGKITVALPPGASPTNALGAIQLYRPSAAGLDRRLDLNPDSHGVQTIDATTVQPGLWRVRVSWTIGQEEYYLDQKVVIGAKAT